MTSHNNLMDNQPVDTTLNDEDTGLAKPNDCSYGNGLVDNTAIYENANKYRLHQDNIRWTLAGGYVVFLVASVKIITDIDDPFFLSILAFVFFCVGLAYLIICGVENWFYKLFAEYVKECDKAIGESKRLPTLTQYTGAHNKEITPEHPSFIPFLSAFAIGNNAYIALLLFKWFGNAAWAVKVSAAFFCIIFTIFSFLVFREFVAEWNDLVYPFVKKYQHLWTKPATDVAMAKKPWYRKLAHATARRLSRPFRKNEKANNCVERTQ